jgi:hypothetical protein
MIMVIKKKNRDYFSSNFFFIKVEKRGDKKHVKNKNLIFDSGVLL